MGALVRHRHGPNRNRGVSRRQAGLGGQRGRPDPDQLGHQVRSHRPLLSASPCAYAGGVADYQELSYDFDADSHVGVITLRRPEARNALTHQTYAELEDAVRPTTARCLVITGQDPAFCSGDDVKSVMGGGERPPAAADTLSRTPR